MGDDQKDLAQEEESHHWTDKRSHVLGRDVVSCEAVDVQGDEQPVQQMVREDFVEGSDVEAKDVVDVVQVVDVASHDVLKLIQAVVVSIVSDTVVNLEDVIANEPNQVREVRSSGLVSDKFKHGLVFHPVQWWH